MILPRLVNCGTIAFMDFSFGTTVAKVPCCICGVPIEPNPSNMCIACLRSRVDITEEVPRTSSIIYCRSCGRYQSGPTTWTAADLESPELLQICLKRLSGLKTLKVVDAKFLYTEPHSRKIRISLTVQKEAINNTVLRQTMIVTFSVNLLQCPDCQEAATPREHWKAKVQLRQSVEHKRTLYWLEQQIISHRAHAHAGTVERMDDGMDFHFQDQASAQRFANFIKNFVPAKIDDSAKQVGEDIQCGTLDMRYTILVRCPTVSRQDIVLLPDYLIKSTGNKSFVAICLKVNKVLKLVDPMSGLIIKVDAKKYWNKPFDPLMTYKQCTVFNVLSIEPVGSRAGAFQVADVEITDEETYTERLIVRTHLGSILKEGDSVLCYDLRTFSLPENAEDRLKKAGGQEVFICAKTWPEKKKKSQKRKWMIKELAPHGEDPDFDEFLDELDENKDLRAGVQIYKKENAPDEELDPEVVGPMVALSELQIDDGSVPNTAYTYTLE